MNDQLPSRRSFPLSVLFIMTAACSVVTALVAPVARSMVSGNVGAGDTLSASIGGGLVIMLLGAVVGMYHYRRWRGASWGLLAGGVIGLVVGPVVLSPAKAFPSLLFMSLLGGLVLLGASLVFRVSARRSS